MLFLLACTGSGDDSATEFVFDRDMVAEECSAISGIVGVGSEWTYGPNAEFSAGGSDLDETIRVTNVDERDVEAQSLRTLTEAAADTGDTASEPEGTIEHYTWQFRCEVDGLYLLSEHREHYASLSMGGGADLSGTRRYDPAVLVLPFSLDDTPSWTESYAGTSDYPGEDAAIAYTRACTALAASPVDFAVGTLSAHEIACTSSDAAHDETYWQVSALGRARDATRELLAYTP
ncbi:MAG: hypothetical protein FJ090_10050 [Deltaproteobacteria bacterium]|nr:hypothetical protein [Deltaproteobacteria bacterium]